jgi:uncharacterized protein YqkB
MQITISEVAGKKISEKTAGRDGYLKLVYDIEGCGCAVNGVPILWFVKEIEEYDEEIKSNENSIYIDKSQQVFFDETMVIDFSVSTNCFQLKSPGQYINPRMSLVDKTK